MEDEITLRLDRATAQDLYVTLYEVERLAGVLRELAHAIGRHRNAYCDHLG